MIATRQLTRMRTNTTTMKTRLLRTALIALLLAPTAAQAQTEEVVFYHTDAIGSVRMITDATGAVLARYDFAPFGEKWDPQPDPDRLQFAGKERDTETGLDYFGARYYRTESGRFTSPDPVIAIDDALLDPQRWNRYAYVNNRPLTLTDPDGRCGWCVALLHRFGPRATETASRYGSAIYNWATRFFNSSSGQEAIHTAAELAAGSTGVVGSLSGNIGRLSTDELATGVRLAQKLGESLQVSNHVGSEFLTAAGKTIDAMGTPAAYANWNQAQFFRSIDAHLRKSNDFTVIDLTGAGKAQIDAIRGYVGGMRNELKDKILFVGELF